MVPDLHSHREPTNTVTCSASRAIDPIAVDVAETVNWMIRRLKCTSPIKNINKSEQMFAKIEAFVGMLRFFT